MTFPRRSARRRIPAQAFGLKDSRRRWSPVSKISDNEHTLPSLRNGARVAVHSHELSVQHSIREPIPEFAQRPEEGAKVPSAVAGQHAGDVLPNDPAGAQAVSQAEIFEGETTARAIHSRALSGDAEILAWGAPHEKVDCRVVAASYGRKVAMKWNLWETVRENCTRKLVNFRHECAAPA